jgi:hypothetical protein
MFVDIDEVADQIDQALKTIGALVLVGLSTVGLVTLCIIHTGG